ncbi:MAG TPA: hypothetical protein VLZ50_16425 [Terracidiphilus sp.]|nr:hypothetical protein [Terracidiphilus sp.]
MKSLRILLALVTTACLTAVAPSTPAQKAAYPAAPVSAAYQPTEQAATVQDALNQFDVAVASHDVALLQAAGIKPGRARGWQKFFKNNPEATVTDDCPASGLMMFDDTAVWTCTETVTLVSEGKPVPFNLGIRFTFARRNGAWTIADRR